MNEKALQTLEYHKIIERLCERATSAPGRALCAALKPYDVPDTINRMQDETSAALGRLLRKDCPSFSGAKDLFGSLKRLEVGSPLSMHELLLTAGLLENAGRECQYLDNNE